MYYIYCLSLPDANKVTKFHGGRHHFTLFHKHGILPFYFHFSKYFIIFLVIPSLIHWLFRSVLFNLHIFVTCSNFLLLLTFNLFPFWSEDILCIIFKQVFLNILRLVLWSVFNNVSYALENIYFVVVMWSIIQSSWLIVFKLLVFWLVVLSIIENEILTWSTTIVELSLLSTILSDIAICILKVFCQVCICL